jgi:glycosyltransferase involved in cell wall biosynthesis
LKTRPSTLSQLTSGERRLKVLLIDNDDFSDYTSYFARGLSKYVDVILYCLSEESSNVTGAANQKGIKFIYINKRLPKGHSSAGGIVRVFILFFILLDALTRTKYDIVHIQDYLPAFFLFIPFLKLRRKRICWTLHDLDIFSLWSRLFATGIDGRLQVLFRKMVTQPTLMSKYVDKILVHALSHKQQLMVKNVEEKKIHVIRQFDYQYLLEFSNNNASTRSYDLVLENNYILFFGNIAPWKGIDTLIEAAKIAKNKIAGNFNLVIAGKPYPGFEGIQFFENIDNEDKKFINIIDKYITSSEIPALVSKASFLVLPYNNIFQYSSSGVIPLSYTFAKPVIVSNVPSLVEYVDHGKTGLIFEVNDSKQLANCIIDLIENNSKCLEMGNTAYQKLVKEMSLDVCCKMINDIYNNIKI